MKNASTCCCEEKQKPDNTPRLKRVEYGGDSSELVVLLHAYCKSRENLRSVWEVVRRAKPNADIFAPNLPIGISSFKTQATIVTDLLQDVDRLCKEKEEKGSSYKEITLVGHSMGALIARKLYVCACGENENAPFGDDIQAKEPRPWAGQLKRIILLAGMNRGWEVNHHLSKKKAFQWSIGLLVGYLVRFFSRKTPIIYTIRRGAAFLTELRIQWLRMRQHVEKKQLGDALTIQLLGSIDDMVSPEDNLDLVSGKDFIYLDVPQSGHGDVIEMGHCDSDDCSSLGKARAQTFLGALTKDRDELTDENVQPWDHPFDKPREDVDDVVFVIHGIRDRGYWTHKIARRICRKGDEQGRTMATETSSYGFFPMLSFLIPGARRRKIHWFMDQYAEAVARYPKAKFSFVGHSNGTYLLAGALRQYACCIFKHVVFAGSVVHNKYNWRENIDKGRIGKVANYVATGDWVVAFFPKAFQMLRLQDLGSAGHDGFRSFAVEEPPQYVRGSHDAALNEKNWDAIAEFILNGKEVKIDPSLRERSQKSWVIYGGHLALVICFAILTVLVFSVWGIWQTHTLLGFPEWVTTVLEVLFLLLIYKIVTRF